MRPASFATSAARTTIERFRFPLAAAITAFSVTLGATLIMQARVSPYFQAALIVFFVAWICLYIASATTELGIRTASVLERFAAFLSRRGSFRSNAEVEAPKFALIRIAFGAFMVSRATWILIYMTPGDWETSRLAVAAVLNLVAACLVTVGLFTQFAFVYLVLIQWQVSDLVMGTSTLGNDIAAMLSVLLIFANAGAHFSADAWLMRKGGSTGRFLSRFYYSYGLPADAVLQNAKFLTLFCYWCVCLYSLMTHLNEPAWMNGSAGPYLLASNFMSAYTSEFSQFLSSGPWAVWVARVSLWAMLPWYAMIVPFVLLGGVWRTYVIAWAILFFSLSLFVLQLGWLAHFEFLFLAALFWQSSFISAQKTFSVLYDDRCNLCDQTVRFIKFVDIFRRVTLRPLSSNTEWIKSKGIDPRKTTVDLYGVDSAKGDKISSGYDLYIALSRNVFLLLPAYPVLVIGKWLRIGPAIYRWIADRRTRIFGVCELPRSKPEHAVRPENSAIERGIKPSDPIVATTLHVALLATGYLLAMPAPYLGWKGAANDPTMKSPVRTLATAAHIYGITPINVFNQTDLRMSENWFTLSAIDAHGQRTLLPVFSETGQRLAMHASDRVYYGFTVRFRRHAIGRDVCLFDDYSDAIKNVARYYKARSTSGIEAFTYTQYNQPLAELDQLLAGVYSIDPPVTSCVVKFNIP